MTINQITQKDWNKLRAYALAIVEDEDYASDLVQEFLLKQLERDKGELEMNSGYTFKGLRLLFLEHIYIENADFRKRFADEYKHFLQLEQEEEIDEEIRIKEDKEKQSKLNTVADIYDQLNTFDQKLFYIHYHKGISQRQISRETGIKLGTIQYRFKLIKQKITNKLNNN